MRKILNSIPLNGVKSISSSQDGLILGDASSGKIYTLYDNNTLSVIYQSGDSFPVNNIISISNSNSLVSIGGKLDVIFNDSFITEENNRYSTLFNSPVSIGNAVTVLDLGDETIIDMIEIEDTGNIVLSTSTGRIIACSKDLINAYLTGKVTVYADVRNGFGVSNSASTDFMYALYKKIAEVNENKEIEKWKFVSNAAPMISEQVIGEFIGPVIHVKEDLGFWKQIYWTETKPDDTDIIISIRSGNSTEELLVASWKYSFISDAGEVSPIIRNLNNITIKGQYLQLKVRMITKTKDITPIVSNVTIKYSTKQASYFFTTKFSFEKNSVPDNGLLVANITEPQNTEVKIGVNSTNSNDWEDYQVVDPDKLFTLTDSNMQNIKVGIKFISYDTNIPEVAEFALFVGGEKVKILSI